MLFATVALALSVASVPQQATNTTVSVDGCATLYGRRVALDTVEIEVRVEPACGPLGLELATPARVSLPRLRAGDTGDYASIGLRAVNRSSEALRAPFYLYASDDLQGTIRGRPVFAWRMRAFASLHTTSQHLWNRDRGDLPPVATPNNQRLSLLPAASPAASEVESVTPGRASGADTLTFWVAADVETWSQPLTVRALRAAPQIPHQPPATFPDRLVAPGQLIAADSVPGRFARDLIRVRFGPKVPYAVRQRFVDRTEGRVVGGVPNGAGGGDYILQVPDSPDGRGVFEAWRRLGQGVPYIVVRRGIVEPTPDSIAPSLQPPRGNVSVDLFETVGVAVNFADDADSTERAATLARVGARVRAAGGDLGRTLIVVGDDSTPAGIEALARRLKYLPTVADVFAQTSSPSALLDSPSIGWWSPPPVDSGRAARDPDIRRFIEALRLPSVHSVRDLLFLRSQGLLFFSVMYGEAMEVYPSVVGVRHGQRIGLLMRAAERPDQVTDTTRSWPRFSLRQDDMVLADSLVLDTLDALEQARILYGYFVLPVLVEDPSVPRRVLRRCVWRIYRNEVGCAGSRVALAATRSKDLATLTQLSFLSGKWSGDGAAIPPARDGLRRLAPTILADPHPARATLFALAQAVAPGPQDSLLIERLLAHPAVQRDAGVLALLADDRPWVLRKLIALLPGGTDVHAAIASLFLPRRGADRDGVAAVLADPLLGRDPVILAAIANAPPFAFPAASAEAGRRLPDEAFRRGAYLVEPPSVP